MLDSEEIGLWTYDNNKSQSASALGWITGGLVYIQRETVEKE